MKKAILAILLCTTLNAQVIVTEDMIYDSIENAIKNGIKGIGELGDYFVKKHMNDEKGFNWYYHENLKMIKILKKRKIDYWTILKQHMYPIKASSYTKEAEIKKYAILKTLCIQNNIIKSETVKRKKKKINIITTDMYQLKKN